MFFETRFLTKKAELAAVWLAAHWERKLSKQQVNAANIVLLVEKVAKPETRLALRLSGHLLLGIARIYAKKVAYLYADCSEALIKIKMAFRPGVNIDLEESTAALHAITLRETIDYEIELRDPSSLEVAEVGAPEIDLNAVRSKAIVFSRRVSAREEAEEDLDLPAPRLSREPREASLVPEEFDLLAREEQGEISVPSAHEEFVAHEDVEISEIPELAPGQFVTEPEEVSVVKSVSEERSEPSSDVALGLLVEAPIRPKRKREFSLADETISISNQELKKWTQDASSTLREFVLAPPLKRPKLREMPAPLKNLFSRIRAYTREASFSEGPLRDIELPPSPQEEYPPVEFEAVPPGEELGSIEAAPELEAIAEEPLSPQVPSVPLRLSLPPRARVSDQTQQLLSQYGRQTTFNTIVTTQGMNRSQAVGLFYELLVLKTNSAIDVEQTEPFGDITITEVRTG